MTVGFHDELNAVWNIGSQGSDLYSERLRNLSALTQARFRVLVLLPADREHGISRLTRSHNDTKFVACCGEIVVCLIT